MKLRDVLRYMILGGLFLLPFSVFIVSNSLFFPYITGKNFFFRIVVEIVFALWVILALLDARYRPKFSWILGSAFAFVALIAISGITGVSPDKSFWSNFERMEGLISLLHFLAYFIVLISVFVKEKLWIYLWNTVVGVSLLQGLYVLGELGGGDRAEGTFGNPIYMSGFMLVVFFLTLWLLYRTYVENRSSWTIWKLVFYVSALFLQVIGIFASGTRGSMLGLFGGLVVFAITTAVFGREHPRIRKVSVGVLLAMLIVGGSFYAMRNTEFVQGTPVLSRLASISATEGTGQARLNLWMIALDGFTERPILGWGQGNFIEVFAQHYTPNMYAQEPWFDRAHNIVLNWLVVGGILGLLAYLSLWVLTLIFIWHPRSEFSIPEKGLWTGLLAAYFFHNLFVFDNVASYLLFFSILGYAHHRYVDPVEISWWQKLLSIFGLGKADSASGREFGSATVGLASVVVGILLVVSVWQLNIQPMGTAKNLVQAASIARQDPARALPHFEKAIASTTLGRAEARAQLALATSGFADQEVDSATKQRYFDLSDEVMRETLEEKPNAVRERLVYTLLLNSYGEHERAIEVAEDALAISPNYQRLHEQLGDAYMGLEDYEQALKVYEGAWELDKEFYSLRTGSVEGLIALNRFDEAAQIIEDGARDIKIGTRGVILSGADISEFIERGYIEVAKKLLEALANASRNNPQGLVSAAAGYLEIGERNKSLQLIERAMEIEPRFISQGQELIEEIQAGRNPLQ